MDNQEDISTSSVKDYSNLRERLITPRSGLLRRSLANAPEPSGQTASRFLRSPRDYWCVGIALVIALALNMSRHEKMIHDFLLDPNPTIRVIYFVAFAGSILMRIGAAKTMRDCSEESSAIFRGIANLVIVLFVVGSLTSIVVMQSQQSAVYVPPALKVLSKYPTIIGLTADHAVQRDIDAMHKACEQNHTVGVGIRVDIKDKNWKVKLKKDLKALELHNPIDASAIYIAVFDNTVKPGYSLMESDPNIAKGLIITNGSMASFSRKIDPVPYDLPEGKSVVMVANKSWSKTMKEDQKFLEEKFAWKTEFVQSEGEGFATEDDISDAVHWLLQSSAALVKK